MTDKLAEYQHFVPTGDQFLNKLGKDQELGAWYGCLRGDQLGVAAGLTKPHDFGQHLKMFSPVIRGLLELI